MSEKMFKSVVERSVAKSILNAKAAESLESQIEGDLQIPDPSGDKATAILQQAIKEGEVKNGHLE